MKLTAFLLIVALQVGARTYSQKLTLNVTRMPLEKVLRQVSDQSGYKFFYRLDQIRQANSVTLAVDKMEFTDVLDILFMNQPFNYAIANKTIVLTSRSLASLTEKIKATDSIPGVITVHGKIVDKNGDPAVGVSVTIMDAGIIAATDNKGEFTLSMNRNARLVLTGVDIAATIIDVRGRTKITVQVLPRVAQLEDIVINKGYYTEQQALSTSDVTTVKGDDIRKTPTTNPILALEGRVPGLFIAPASGLPGTTFNILLRGKNTFVGNGGDPLYIIDGVPFNSGTLSILGSYIGGNQSALPNGVSPLSTINPADIEEITVLKDADATAIYGSRGTNGVILITTKKGHAGKTAFNIDVSQSDAKYPKFIKMLNTQQYLTMRHEAYKNDGASISSDDYSVNGVWDTTRYTDWQKALLGGTAHMTNAQMSLTGGSSNTQFTINGGYRRQTLVYTHSDQADKQATFRASVNHTSNDKKFEAALTVGYTNDNNTLPTSDPTFAITLAPDAPALYTADGKINWGDNTNFINNPAARLLQSNKSVSVSLMDNLVLRYHLLPGLTLQTSMGYNTMELTELTLVPGTAIDPADLAGGYVQREADYANSNTKSWIIEPQASYTHTFGEGRLDALTGATFQENTGNGYGFQSKGFSSDAQLLNYSTGQNKTFFPQQYSDYKYTAIYARINYTLKERYILNLTGRRDGSSHFGPGKQFGNFGSAGGAWIFTRESWWKGLSWLSFGKLRANYGITGNDNTSNYEYLSTYAYSSYTYSGLTSLIPNQLSNPYLAWDVNKKAEAGIDLGFWADRINLNVSYYRNRSGNQLVSYQLPAITGFNQVASNLPAVIQNTGLEVTLNTVNVKTSNFAWRTSLNLTVPRNKWVSFPNLDQTPYANFVFLGKSLFVSPSYRFTGVDPLTGVMKYQDVNKDGQVSPSDWVEDKEISQKLYGGFNNSLSWKGWQLDVFFSFVRQTGKSLLSAFPEAGGPTNQPAEVLARWQQPGDVTAIQKFSYYNSAASQAYSNFATSGSNAIVNTSFVRLENINLSYSLPAAWKERMHLQNVQLYAQGDNLLTWTSFNGADPQVGGRTLPPLRQFLLGLRVSL